MKAGSVYSLRENHRAEEPTNDGSGSPTDDDSYQNTLVQSVAALGLTAAITQRKDGNIGERVWQNALPISTPTVRLRRTPIQRHTALSRPPLGYGADTFCSTIECIPLSEYGSS